MKSKKFLLSLIIVIILISGGVIWKLSANNNVTKDAEISKTTTDTESHSNNDSTSQNNSSNNEEKTVDSENNPTDKKPETNDKLSEKDAAINIVKHFIGETQYESQHITPVVLNGQVAKYQENSNTFYCDSEEFTDNSKTGLIIVLDSYDESSNSYKYTLKDYYAILNGKTDSLGVGTVSSNGTVTED